MDKRELDICAAALLFAVLYPTAIYYWWWTYTNYRFLL